MSTIRVARELNLFVIGELKNLLETSPNRHENVLTLFSATALATSNIAVSTARNAFANGTSPDTDTIEGLSHVDNDTHDLAIVLLLQSLTDGTHHNLQPQAVNIDVSLLLVLE